MPTIEKHPTNPAHVRLTWAGIVGAHTKGGASAGVCFADFDPCPVRNLTALESAQDWSMRVLGNKAEIMVDTLA